jgi:hypothetical protein
MPPRHALTPASLALALALSACAGVGTPRPSQPGAAEAGFALPDWREPEPEGTLRASALVGAPVVAPGGPLGRVADLAVGPDERLAAVVVEGPSGRSTLAWSDLRPERGALRLGAGAPRDGAPPAGTWSALGLVGDPVTLEDEAPYGTVEDLSFAPDGRLRAVIVRPDEGFGAAGEALPFPFFGARFGFDPEAPRYRLPYGTEALG